MAVIRAFNVKDDLVFSRMDDGSVAIILKGIRVALIDSGSWCSVIATMSLNGETTDAWRTAVCFHEAGDTFPLKPTYSA